MTGSRGRPRIRTSLGVACRSGIGPGVRQNGSEAGWTSGVAPGSSPGIGSGVGTPDGSPLGTTSGSGLGSLGVVVIPAPYPPPLRVKRAPDCAQRV